MTLALAYAELYPERVAAMVLDVDTMTRRADVRWLSQDTGRFFPEEWARFRAGVPEAERDGDLVAAYDRVLNGHADPAVRIQAARDWVAWEDAILSLEEGYVVPNPRWADERFMVGFARLVTHYFSHAAWLEEDELLRNAPRLAGIPGVLITAALTWPDHRTSPGTSPRHGPRRSSNSWLEDTPATPRWSGSSCGRPTASHPSVSNRSPGRVRVPSVQREYHAWDSPTLGPVAWSCSGSGTPAGR